MPPYLPGFVLKIKTNSFCFVLRLVFIIFVGEMDDRKQMVLPSGCRLIAIPNVIDERGGLVFAEADSLIPFPVQRVFWIYDVPREAVRGGHAHWVCSEFVVPVTGAFTMVVDDGQRRAKVRLERPDEGILIPAGVWCELCDFEPGTVVVVMASHHYDAGGYVHDYADYLKQKER